MIDNLIELRTFAAIVEAGSLTAAATALGVTPNAISRRLSQLEARVGRRLIHRTTRRLSITEEGRRFHARCRTILDELKEAERELAGADGLGGTLRIALHSDMISPAMMASLRDMLQGSPRLQLQLHVDSRFIDPIRSGLDLSVHVGEPAASSLIARSLGTLTWSLAATPTYLAQHGTPRSPEQLVDHECLRMLRKGPETHWELSRGAGRVHRVAIGGRFEATDGAALASALYAGVGIGVRLRSEIDQAVHAGRLQHVLEGWQWARTPVYAMLPKGRLKVPAVRALVDVLKSAIQAHMNTSQAP